MNHILASFKIESALTAAMRDALNNDDHVEGVQIAIDQLQTALRMTFEQRIAMNARILTSCNAAKIGATN